MLKSLVRFAVLFALAGSLSFGQFIGSVVAVRNVPAENGSEAALAFPLYGELTIAHGNYFTASPSYFNLAFTSADVPALCVNGCNYTAIVDTWYTMQAIGDGCATQSADMVGTLVQNNTIYTDAKGVYTQVYCAYGNNHYWTGGNLVVELP
jgi:hypothetical protein